MPNIQNLFKDSRITKSQAKEIKGGIKVTCTLEGGGSHVVEGASLSKIFDAIDAYNAYADANGLAGIGGCAI